MTNDIDRSIVEELTRRLLAHDGARIKRVILYGSRAQGTARPESDYDLLVVESGPVATHEEVMRLRRALDDLSLSVDVWVMDEQEFQETKNVIGGLAYPAHKYGVVLYEGA